MRYWQTRFIKFIRFLLIWLIKKPTPYNNNSILFLLLQAMEKNIVLLLGGNIGDSRGYIRNALALLEQNLGFISHLSSFYQTQAWGFNANDFINLAVVIQTSLEPNKCLEITQEVEEELGRIDQNSGQNYASREIDIDIIFYEKEIINTAQLVIPHPKMQERNFVLQALSEIIPDFAHPILNKNIKELAAICPDKQSTKQLYEQV